MKPILTLLLILCVHHASVLQSHAAEGKPARPNVLTFLTDDESWLERSAYGWSKIPTPNFDRVAKPGVLFTHGYTSAPSCAPSRAALLTGRNFWELEQRAFIQAWLPSKFPVLPDMLEAGVHASNSRHPPAFRTASMKTAHRPPARLSWWQSIPTTPR